MSNSNASAKHRRLTGFATLAAALGGPAMVVTSLMDSRFPWLILGITVSMSAIPLIYWRRFTEDRMLVAGGLMMLIGVGATMWSILLGELDMATLGLFGPPAVVFLGLGVWLCVIGRADAQAARLSR